MNAAALDQAYHCLEAARRAVATMKTTTDRQEFLGAWYDFLTVAHRFYTKLDIGSKAGGKSRDWFGRKIHQRKTDELLRYIHHARNANDHGIAHSAAPGAKIGPPEFGDRPIVDIMFTPDGRVETRIAPVQLHPIHSDPACSELFPVVDSGNTYDPPSQHFGQPIERVTPLQVAELGVATLRDLYLEALQVSRNLEPKK